MRPSHTCLGCGWDLAAVRVRMLAGVPVRAAECPRCGRVWPRRLPGRPLVRTGALTVGVLAIQALLGAGLMATSTAALWWSGSSVQGVPGCEHLHDLFLNRDARTGEPAVLTWLAGSWGFLLVPPLMSGLWVTLGLSHWRQRWMRIPAWVAIQLGLLTAGWLWPLAAWWWSGADAAPSRNLTPLEPFLTACMLAVLCAPLMTVWLPLERAVVKGVKADSILTELLRRRLRKKRRHA